jgi:hypothetical protein
MREEIIMDWLASPDRDLLSDAALRLARHTPRLQRSLDASITDPVSRSLAGLQSVPALDGLSPGEQLRACLAAMDAGSDVPVALAENLEDAFTGGAGWVHAARIHVYSSTERERRARMALSEQLLPFVPRGEICPLQVELFAAGDSVLHVLHADWVRKLSGHVVGAMEQDCRELGLWHEPLVSVLPGRILSRTLSRLRRSPRLTPDGAGLAAYYAERNGEDPAPFLLRSSSRGRLLYAFGAEAALSIADN